MTAHGWVVLWWWPHDAVLTPRLHKLLQVCHGKQEARQPSTGDHTLSASNVELDACVRICRRCRQDDMATRKQWHITTARWITIPVCFVTSSPSVAHANTHALQEQLAALLQHTHSRAPRRRYEHAAARASNQHSRDCSRCAPSGSGLQPSRPGP
jgi:hypothetical protein